MTKVAKKRPGMTPAQWAKVRSARIAAVQKQQEGFESNEIFKLSVEAKLAELRPSVAERLAGAPKPVRWFENFQRCGRDKVWSICLECERTKELPYHCNLKWCPFCNWRIANRRRQLLEKITKGMTGVKHVVLTQRNFATLSKAKIQQSRKNLLALRRQKIFGKVSGGCASLEFTNESRGWHMHWHMLIASPFIDAKELSIQWGRLVDQEFAIVKVMDVTEKSYVQEVCKYVAKGSELAKMPSEDIFQLIEACRGVRMFTVFGKFSQIRKSAAAEINCERPESSTCDCGCHQVAVGESKEMVHRIFNKLYGCR